MSNKNQTTNNNNTSSKLSLETPIPFDGTYQSKFVTTLTLSKYINELFRCTFKDYIGCTVSPNLNNQNIGGGFVALDLYFAPNSDNGKGASITGFCPIGVTPISANKNMDVKKNNYLATALKHNAITTTSSTMQITQEAIDLLYDLMLFGLKGKLKKSAKSFSDLGVTVEATDNRQYQYGNTRPSIYNIIRGLDINEVMRVIHGDKNNSTDYQVSPVKPILQMMGTNGYTNQLDAKWLYSITELNRVEVTDLMNELGLYNKVSDLGIMTEGFN